MAKATKKTKTAKPVKKALDPAILEAFAILDGLNDEACILDESALSVVNSFVDTGCYGLNAIISGSLYGGIPSGRIAVFAGPSGCGKTLMCAKVIACAQKAQNRYAVVFDSEIAFDKQTAVNLGCDPTRIKHIPVETVESLRNQIVPFLKHVIANPHLKGKIIIVVDSLGNLSSEKENADADKGKTASDMGIRAKAIKSLFRTITYKAAKADVPIVFTNHIYDDPAALYESIKKNQGGGKGPEYLSSVVVQMSMKQERSATEEHLGSAREATGGSVVGNRMTAMTTKNRFVPPFLETELLLNFLTGLKPYHGLLDMAIGLGVVTSNGKTYAMADGTKLGYRKDIEEDAELWKGTIMEPLEAKLQATYKFSTPDVDDLVADIETAELEIPE